MSPAPDSFLRAASFEWETLIPIVFFILYGIAQFFGSRNKSDEEETPAERPNGDQLDPLERARQIRDEIQRKVRERAEASRQPQEQTESRPAGTPRYDPNLPESRQYRQSAPMTDSGETSAPSPRSRPASASDPSRADRARIPETNIEKRLREQQQRLAQARKRHDEARERARKRQAEAQSQARKMKSRLGSRSLLVEPGPTAKTNLAPPSHLRASLLADLRHPDSLRKAVLLREILGSPRGLQ